MADASLAEYEKFLRDKFQLTADAGFALPADVEVNPMLRPHQRDIVKWAVRKGYGAIFCSFGLGKTFMQLEIARLIQAMTGESFLIVIPLGVRLEFMRDAATLGIAVKFIRSIEEAGEPGIYLTNYETVRDGRLDPRHFGGASLDEAAILASMGGTKTFREFMKLFAGDDRSGVQGVEVKYRYVATATPSPNEYIELLAYAQYLGVMQISEAKTRFFKRDSVRADKLTLHKHKEHEFWVWCASWAIFLQRPSDLGYSDDGYALPDIEVHWHEVSSDHSTASEEAWGQKRLLKHVAIGVTDAAREKRESLPSRVAKMMELRALDPAAHRVIWHDLEAERDAIERAIPGIATVYGAQDLDEREGIVSAFSEGEIPEIGAKPVMLGSGCNLQRHCHWAIFLGIGFKFRDFIQAIHRIHRFLQTKRVRIDLIYTEAEAEVKRALEAKWTQHKELVEQMSEIIREHGLAQESLDLALRRSIGVERVEVSSPGYYRAVNNDCVLETARMAENSVGLVLTSIPFSTQYEYSPSYNDFGHNVGNPEFWRQMDFLTPNLLRVLKPGRICAIHVKDRITPGGINGLGFQTVYPFHVDAILHYQRHGFAYMGMKTIVTDVVRENNQTYRLGWTEQCKDGTKMGVGMPEYLLLFRKPPTSTDKSYADEPVVKDKGQYSRSRWQIDAHGFTRSSGNRQIKPEELDGLTHADIFQLFKSYSLNNVYDFEQHVRIGEQLEATGRLPVTFMLLQPQSWSDEVWTDITRMLTLNGAQSAQGREMHLCLARDSRVLTKERGYIPIQDVRCGEHTLTHRGRWRKVLAVKMTGVQPVITVRAQGVPGLTLTPDHKLWTRKSDWARQRDGAERAEPGWIEAQETIGAYLNQKLPPEQDRGPDTELWWTVGRWLADGHIGTHGEAIISVGPHKWDAFVEGVGRFGGNGPHRGTAWQVRINDPAREVRDILERCGRGAERKRLPPEAFALSAANASALLDGYLAGDGHFIDERDGWQMTSASRDLLLGLSILVQRVHGAIASIRAGRGPREHIIEGRKVFAQQEWQMSFDLPGGRKTPFILDDGAWKRVRQIEDAGEAETWCLKVDEDESFTAEGCVVKNCPMQFDIADRCITQFTQPGEVVLDPFGGLMTVPYRAVMLKRQGIGIELSPRYFMDGCHYLKAAENQVTMPGLFDLDAMDAENGIAEAA